MERNARPREWVEPEFRTWKVGELSRRTGVSVRTLHHYEEIGLLIPSGRTTSRHRYYSAGDIARLHRIITMRQLGFSLETIRNLLDRPEFSAREVVEKHLVRSREHLGLQQRLCERLEFIAAQHRSSETVSVEELLQTIEMMNMIEKYYTPKQLDELRQRGEAIGKERIREVEAEWPALIARVREEMEKGTDPAGETMQTLARQWASLIREFTGGNPEIESSLRRMYQQEPPVAARSDLDPGIMAYVGKAMAAMQKQD